MWPWTRTVTPPDPEIVALRARCEAVERTVRDIRTDWDATYEKFQRLNATLAARWRRLNRAEAEAGQGGGDQSEGVVEGGGAAQPGAITNPLALELLRRRG